MLAVMGPAFVACVITDPPALPTAGARKKYVQAAD